METELYKKADRFEPIIDRIVEYKDMEEFNSSPYLDLIFTIIKILGTSLLQNNIFNISNSSFAWL